MAKRKSNRRRRASGQQRRGGRPAAGVGRPVTLDNLLLPQTATGDVAPVAPQPSDWISPPQERPHPIRSASESQLEAVPDAEPDGPHVRLGAMWAVVTFVATAGLVSLALWYALAAAIAALQAARSWRKQPRPPDPIVTAAGAALIPVAATISLGAVGVAATAVAIAALLYRPDPTRANPVFTAAIALGFGLAAASPVVTRRLGLVEVLVLISLVGAYDASAYLVGAGATRWWEGPAAGVAFMFTVTLAAAAVFVPPFDGVAPWLLGILAAGTVPLGPLVADRLLGDAPGRVPAVRRLDSLLVAGPLWTAAAYALL